MTGENKLHLNKATVCEMLQKYLNEHVVTANVQVTNVTVEYGGDQFIAVIVPLVKEVESGPE